MLEFLPRPRSIAYSGEWLTLGVDAWIGFAPEANDAVRRAARSLQTAIREATGLAPALMPLAGNERVVMLAAGAVRPEDRFETLSPAPLDDLPDSYAVRGDTRGLAVFSASDAGLFYGVQTLIQIARQSRLVWPIVTIDDAPVLPHRGLMLDVSRGKVPTLETLISLAKLLAHYKFNQLQLYVEHTFAFPRFPEIGSGSDPLTPDEIMTLDAVCRELHIDLVPNLQSVGHQRALLNIPRYSHLAETPWNWSLATVNDEAFVTLDELYADFLPAFSSGYFNVNADEPYDLARGLSASLAAEIGVGGVFLRHIQRLHSLVTAHGRTTMIWADVFWHYPDLVSQLPDDIVLLDWWYEVKERYDTVDVIARSGRRFYVCPGTSSWSALFPRLETAIANIQRFVRDGVAAGAEGMLVTDWGDDGHYQLSSNSRYAQLWAAECAWNGGETTSEQFDPAFGVLFLHDLTEKQVSAIRRLGAAMQEHPVWSSSWYSAMAYFEDPLAGMQHQIASPEIVAEAKKAAQALLALTPGMHDVGIRRGLGFVATQIIFATNKVTTSRAIHQLLDDITAGSNPETDALPRFDQLLVQLEDQRARIPALAAEFAALWLAHSRPAGLGRNLDRHSALAERYAATIAWIGQQRAAWLAGEPVDAALTSYDAGGYRVLIEERLDDVLALEQIIGREALPPDLIQFLEELMPTPVIEAVTS